MSATGQTVDKTENKDLNGADTPDYEALASEIGWAPKDKFRGDPSKHIDAKTYYEKGEFVLPIVKKQRDEAKAHAEKSDKTIAELKAAMADFQKFTEAAAERKVSELQAEISSLKGTRAAAVAAGDDKAFREADDAIEERKEAIAAAKEKPVKPEPKEDPSVDPAFSAWLDENRWYADDPKKKKLADEFGIYYANADGLKGKPLYDAVAAKMKSLESEVSGKERAGPQRGGKPSGSDSKAKTFENLPQEYKDGFKKMERAGFTVTKEQYAEQCDPSAWSA